MSARPLISDAESLIPYLYNVRHAKGIIYLYGATPPCHDSLSGKSLSFGDHPDGGLSIKCWKCKDRNFIQRIEDALEVRLQVNEGGLFRYNPRESGRTLPQVIHNAVLPVHYGPELYTVMESIYNHPDVTDIIYSWSGGGFKIDGPAHLERRLAEASKFMDKVVRACPYYMRNQFFWDTTSHRVGIMSSANEIDQYWGVTTNALQKMVRNIQLDHDWEGETPTDSWLVDELIRLEKIITEYRKPVRDLIWDTISDAIQPMKLALEEHPDNQAEFIRYLVATEME